MLASTALAVWSGGNPGAAAAEDCPTLPATSSLPYGKSPDAVKPLFAGCEWKARESLESAGRIPRFGLVARLYPAVIISSFFGQRTGEWNVTKTFKAKCACWGKLSEVFLHFHDGDGATRLLALEKRFGSGPLGGTVAAALASMLKPIEKALRVKGQASRDTFLESVDEYQPAITVRWRTKTQDVILAATEFPFAGPTVFALSISTDEYRRVVARKAAERLRTEEEARQHHKKAADEL